jgi:nitroimidazol reductase NimA-like FMN-containing flavoprotein (pyridoxamine 5'-phosphate oxidase superfamily)
MFRFQEKHHMRRTDKEITNSREIDTILSKAMICRIGLVDHNVA